VNGDFGYIEEGDQEKGWDLRLLGRLGAYLKPYRTLMAVSLLSVLLMAACDLFIPWLTREAIDRYILADAREVVIKDDESSTEKRFLARYGRDLLPRSVKGRFLLPSDALRRMDAGELALLQREGIITDRRFHLFPVEDGKSRAVLAKYPGLVEKAGVAWAIAVPKMKELARDDLLSLRRIDLDGIAGLVLVGILVLAANFGLNFLQVYTMEMAGQRMMHDLRLKTFAHVQALPLAYFDRHAVGRLVTRLTNDVQNIHEMFTSVLVYLLKDVLLLAGIIVILALYDPTLALAAMAVCPLIYVLTLLFSRLAREAFREIRSRVGQMNGFFQEHFSGIEIVQLFRREKESARRFGGINEAHALANLRQIHLYGLFVPLVDLLSSTAIGLLLWYGGGEVIRGRISVGVLVAFIAYMRMFFQPIRDLSEKYTILQSALASTERILSLLSRRPEPRGGEAGRSVRGSVEFKSVSFSYDGKERILKEVSFSVPEGKTVAIVGATGAGKTSILNLLERFYEVNEGVILVDGIDLREWALSDLRSGMGMVMQETFLFSGEIGDNIRLGRGADGMDGVREAARTVDADEWIRRLPEGYGTRVGEGEEALSAGEKQLLAFARAVYGGPRILILDEATSHVDPATERLIQEGLGRLLKGKTALVVAHRLSTIQKVDQILVLHKGRVREAGTHAELLARGGLYSKLYRLQYNNRKEDRWTQPTVG
jgi:ATP-binding cassette subfamily B multidrug efflux pump